MSKGISNSQTESAFKNMEDEGINNDFMDIFPSNYLNKFNNHTAMMSQKRENIHLSLQILTALARVARTVEAYLILNLKLTSSYPILLVLMVCDILLFKMMRKLLKKSCLRLKQ